MTDSAEIARLKAEAAQAAAEAAAAKAQAAQAALDAALAQQAGQGSQSEAAPQGNCKDTRSRSAQGIPSPRLRCDWELSWTAIPRFPARPSAFPWA